MKEEPAQDNIMLVGDTQAKVIEIKIPKCCEEGWDSCPHVVNRDKKATRTNIAL